MFHFHTRRRHFFTKINELIVARFMLAIALASIDTIWAVYMDSFGLSESAIGFLSASLVIVSVFSAFNSTQVLEKIREYKVLILSLVVFIICYLLIYLTQNLLFFFILSIVLTIASILRMESFDILFRDESNDKDLNGNEGLMYAIVNVGWLIGPLYAALIISMYDVKTVFVAGAVFVAISLFILLFMNLRLPKKERKGIDSNVFLNFKSYIKNKRLHIPYLMASGIEVWWSLIYIYVPLFMLDSGLSEEYIGLFLAAICVPLMIFEFPVGKFSEKHGFRWLFVFGFAFLAVSSLVCFFVDDIHYILVILVIASFGMAFLEPIQDSYFFRQVKLVEEEKYYPIYSTAGDFGGFLGRFCFAFMLLFLPSSFVYLLMAIFMAGFAMVAFRIKG